jgi:hypothetical protein
MVALWMASLVARALDIHVSEPVPLPVDTADNLPPTVGFTANARIQPHGDPATWWIEYGPDETYGSVTEPRALPGRLTAHFREDWADGTRQWAAGMSGVQLTHRERGGPDGGPFLRYTDDQTAGDDTNHLDGIGMIHLGPYAYLGNYTWAYPSLPLYLGGGFPDFRGATISVALRGVDWEPHGTEIGTWIQAYRDPSVVDELPEDLRYPNWAFTGDPQTAHLVSGEWEDAEWVLRNRTADWTFAGANGGRLLYDYGELDTILRGVNVDFFLLQILYVDLVDQPTGSIDVADLEITFRQHSVCAASNGGRLVEDPAGGTGAQLLTDGWRNGVDHEWQSGRNPTGPQTFVYAFEDPITLTSFTIHNAVRNPSARIAVDVSEDGGGSWTTIQRAKLPESSPDGPNFVFFHGWKWVLDDEGTAIWAPLHPNPIDRLRVRVLSGYRDERWGLGEIEAFGTGATERTDDDWYDMTQDVLVAPGAWHFRAVAATATETVYGPDQVVRIAPRHSH